jgi:hypothetical protein
MIENVIKNIWITTRILAGALTILAAINLSNQDIIGTLPFISIIICGFFTIAKQHD